jgi:multiple sugar transport system substrate-binding protein
MEVDSMKNTILSALILILGVLCAFAGGNQEGAAERSVTFVFWDYAPEVQKGWETTLANFKMDNPDVNIDLVGAQGNSWGEYLDKVATMIAGGRKLDVIWVATEGIRQLATSRLIRPVDDLIARDRDELQEYFDDVAPSLIEGTRVDGKLYGFPYSWNNMVVWYSPSRVNTAGLAAPEPDWTKDDFLMYAQKLTKDNVYGYAVENAYFTGSIPWLFANGTNLFDERFENATATDPKVVEAMQFLVDLVHKYQVAPDPAGVSTFNMFQAGQLSMFGAGRWPILTFSKDPSFKDYDVQLWPRWRTQLTEYGVDNFPIFTSCQNVEGAWKLVKYMTRKDVQSQMVGTADKPVGNVPARRSLATSPDMASIANYKVFYDSLDNARSVPAPPGFNKVESIWLRYLSQMTANELPVKEALEKAQTELTQVLNENK